MDLWKTAAVLHVPSLSCVPLLPVLSLKQWFRSSNCCLNVLCYYIQKYIYLMDTSGPLVPNYLLAKIEKLESCAEIIIIIIIILDKLATV